MFVFFLFLSLGRIIPSRCLSSSSSSLILSNKSFLLIPKFPSSVLYTTAMHLWWMATALPPPSPLWYVYDNNWIIYIYICMYMYVYVRVRVCVYVYDTTSSWRCGFNRSYLDNGTPQSFFVKSSHLLHIVLLSKWHYHSRQIKEKLIYKIHALLSKSGCHASPETSSVYLISQ